MKTQTIVSATVSRPVREGPVKGARNLIWWQAEVSFFSDRVPTIITIPSPADEEPPLEHFVAAAAADAIRAAS